MNIWGKIFVGTLLWAVLGSCTRSEGIITAEVDFMGWSAAEPVTLKYENNDTTSLRDIKFLVRRSAVCADRDLPLTIETVLPTKEYTLETTTIPIRHGVEQGFSEVEIPYRTKVVLSRRGTYTFTISHCAAPVKGVVGIGIIIK